jgi:hypothetical protein
MKNWLKTNVFIKFTPHFIKSKRRRNLKKKLRLYDNAHVTFPNAFSLYKNNKFSYIGVTKE